MVPHDSAAGHGHVGSHAIGMAGGHWTLQTLSGEKRDNNLLRHGFCIGRWLLAKGMRSVYKGHWTLAEWSLEMG